MTHEKDILDIKGQKIEIEFYSHASFSILWNGKSFYFDPLMEYAPFDRMSKADFIFVTHSHSDHFDAEAVASLRKQDTVVVTNKETASELADALVMNNGDEVNYYDFLFRAYPAYNTTPGRDCFHPKGRDNGYLLEHDGVRIYVAGDTEIVAEDEFTRNCDILLLSVNQPYTMNIEQAYSAVSALRPKIVYPIHTTDTDLAALGERLSTTGSEVRFRSMK